MTPKQKAIDLVEQFSSVLMHDEVYEDSVKCALISVDEILNNKELLNHLDFEWWSEVKQEINNL
jgi:hypothetical protein